tara:strand:- start:610 stop:2070 length:1461 start_codon:yes stop_codon:yes gene_type:complete
MTVKINYFGDKIEKNLIVFCDDKFHPIGVEKDLGIENNSIINKFISLNGDNKKDVLVFNINHKQKIVAIKIDPKNKEFNIESKGADLHKVIKSHIIKEIYFLENNVKKFELKNKDFLNEVLHGLMLNSYEFDKYKTKSKEDRINLFLPKIFKKNIEKKNSKYLALLDGTNLTKDLVSEPGNILHPDEYVKRIKKLKNLGLKISVYDKKKLKKLGMNALLGVGQGSDKGSYLVVIEWNGHKRKNKPIAFVGKGVCFDTGGISLKPAKFMEDMTYDMAGSAVVVGLMKNLALRKAKVNAVGVVGLVENMPDGNAQRPGDIVKSYSGKTIEILNTDAEGRLVLADALTFTEKKYKPKFIVDLATLTGAIIVSLGSEYAGLFSNDDKLSDELFKSGNKVGEKVWRMPLNENYDKLINSKKADMQNINYVGGAGSTTAAQFLQRFILNKTPWAHLDIAGMAFSKYGGALNSGGATGFGVRLLNKLIEDYYE